MLQDSHGTCLCKTHTPPRIHHFLLISEIKTCAISSSFCRPSLIAVVCGMSKPVNYFKALAGEVLGLRLCNSFAF